MADTLNLLLIEDDHDVSNAIAMALIQEGHEVKLASTLLGARRQLRLAQENGTPFDAILSDFWLEHNGDKTSGSETYETIRKIAGPEVPLLCASSDIVMWERIKNTEEDERMFTKRKVSGLDRLSHWDADWVKTILAGVKNLPPLPKKLPGILLAGKDPSSLQGTTNVLEEAGYQVTVVDNPRDAVDHLLPRGGVKPKVIAIISDFELAGTTGRDLFIMSAMRKPAFPFIATGEDLEKWVELQKLAGEQGLTLHLTARDPALFLAKLKELGL